MKIPFDCVGYQSHKLPCYSPSLLVVVVVVVISVGIVRSSYTKYTVAIAIAGRIIVVLCVHAAPIQFNWLQPKFSTSVKLYN